MKRLLALILAFSMIFALAACGDDEEKKAPSKEEKAENATGQLAEENVEEAPADEVAEEEPSLEDILAETRKAAVNLKSEYMIYDIDLSLNLGLLPITATVHNEAQFDVNSNVYHHTENYTAMGTTQITERYLYYGDPLTRYENVNSAGWSKTLVENFDDLALSDTMEGIATYKSIGYCDAIERDPEAVLETDSFEGVECYKISSSIDVTSPDVLAIFNLGSAFDALKSFGISEDQAMEDFEPIDFVIYIDKESFNIVGLELEGTAFVKSFLELMPNNPGLSCSKCVGHGVYSQQNQLTVEIPEDVLNS